MEKKSPVDVVSGLMRLWHVRDLNQNDFNKAISDLLGMQKEEETK